MPRFGRPSPEDDRRAERYGEWLQRRNPYAIASFVLGLFSLIEFGALVIPGVAGIVLGIVALVQLRSVARESGGSAYAEGATEVAQEPAIPKTHGHAIAIFGIVFSILSLILAALLYFRIVGG